MKRITFILILYYIIRTEVITLSVKTFYCIIILNAHIINLHITIFDGYVEICISLLVFITLLGNYENTS